MENKKKKRVAFLTLGCKVNSYETNAMEQLFLDNEYEIVSFSQKAEVFIINTCTVTNMADRKSRQMLHRAKKMNPEGVVVAVGCYVQASKERAEQDESIDLVIGNNQKRKIVEIVEAFLENKSIKNTIPDMSEEYQYEELEIEKAGEKTRAYIKIQDGCNQFCSYCIIPYARGRIRSRKENDIIKEVSGLVAHGYQEVVLTGIHLSSYGIGEKDNFVEFRGKPLLSLIQKLNAMEGLQRIRLGSLEPRIITEDFVKTLYENEKVCPHFHLSLQSGSDDTLKRMNRKYSTEEYYEKCQILRKYYENPAITTDVIVGFPGETEREFEETKSFLEKIAFAQMHIFKYSVRKGTRAERMVPQIDESVKHKRSEYLLQLEENMRTEYCDYFIGKKQKVLLEETVILQETEYQVGHNERYLKCAIRKSEIGEITNQIVEVTGESVLEHGILLCR